jgi:tetratricopeptide (TPR) repeat protein
MRYTAHANGLWSIVIPVMAALTFMSFAPALAATTDAQKALDANPKDVVARLDLIQSSINSENYSQAEQLANTGVKLLPGDASLWAARGAAYFSDGVAKRSSENPGVDELKLAAESYEQALKLDAHAVQSDQASAAFAQYGLVLSQQEQYAQCLSYAGKAAGVNPKAWQYAMLKGDCESGLQEYPAALADYRAAQQANDNTNPMISSRLLAATGNAQLKTGDVSGGLQLLNKAVALDPKAPYAYQTLYAYYTSLTVPDLPKALDALQHLAQLQPNDPHVQINIGNIYLRENKFEMASDAFSKALQIDPKNADAQFGFAELAASQNDLKATDAALNKAIAMSPSEASFYEASIAQLLLSQSSTSQLHTDHPMVAAGGTASYTATSDRALEAGKYADAATRADPSDGTAWFWLGLSYGQQGKKDLAAASLRKAQEIFASKTCVDIHFSDRGSGTSCLDYQKMMLAQANAAYAQLSDTDATMMGSHGVGGGTGKDITTNGDMPH